MQSRLSLVIPLYDEERRLEHLRSGRPALVRAAATSARRWPPGSPRSVRNGDLPRPASKAQSAQRVIRRARRNRIGHAPGFAHRGQRPLPAVAHADVESARVQPHIAAHNPRQLDVADLVVEGVRRLALYNLAEDRFELFNRAADRPQVLASLLAKLNEIADSVHTDPLLPSWTQTNREGVD